MKTILVLSRNAWSTENSTGNTLSNTFSCLKDKLNYKNIFCRNETPHNNICNQYLKLTEKEFLKKNKITGELFSGKFDKSVSKTNSSKLYKNTFFKKSYLLKLIRDFIWRVFLKKEKVNNFIDDVDLIYMHIFDSIYMLRLCLHCAKTTKKQVILWTGDDNFSTHFSINPFYFLYRLLYMHVFKKLIKHTKIILCNNEALLNLVKEKKFGVKCKLLMKSFDLKGYKINSQKGNNKILYAGNLNLGRDKIIKKFSTILERFNKDNNYNLAFDIYTQQFDQIKFLSEKYEHVNVFKAIPYDKLLIKQREYSYLLHVESFNKFNIKKTKFSISTKISDYLYSNRPIVCIGPSSLESINYLIKNNICLYINGGKEMQNIQNLSADSYLQIQNLEFNLLKMNHDSGKNFATMKEIIL